MARTFGDITYLKPLLSGGIALLLSACGANPYKGPVLTEEPDLGAAHGHLQVRGSGNDYTTSIPMLGAALAVNEDRPNSYTVVRGDTLWDISGRFLEEPWRWPEVWQANPNIKNPHLIYPGDKIRLEYGPDGKPRLVVNRNGVDINGFDVADLSGNVERLSPRIREESLEEAIPMIPGDSVRQFLVHPRVVERGELASAPYIVGNDEQRLASAVGQEIYARGNISGVQRAYGVFRNSKPLIDPQNNEYLGQEITHVANAKLLESGDPSTLVITKNYMETINGDRLLAANQAYAPHQYIPRTPQFEGSGRIVSLVDSITRSGRNQVVVLNLGKRNQVQVGDVLAVESRGATLRDRISSVRNDVVKLPNRRTGVVMVFQTFEKVSYALVMESSRPIFRNDIVSPI